MSPRLQSALLQLPELLTAHLQLTMLSIVLATGFSIPLGVLAVRVQPLKQPVLAVAGIVQTIPALALLAVMVPLLSGMGLPGIGFLPALLGLTAYCVLPILWGTVTGLSEIDRSMIDAAHGVGMTNNERLWLVELPLAMPIIVAGLRTATVWGVGMATLSTPIGAPSLGHLIFSGLQTRNYTSVLVGCISAAVLAQVLDRLVQGLEIGFSQRRPALLRMAAVALLSLGLFSITSFVWSQRATRKQAVMVGAKAFTEQYILSSLVARKVSAQGLAVTVTPSLGSSVVFDALRRNDIDLYVDYSGTIWTMVMGRKDIPKRREDVLQAVRTYLKDTYNITVVAALGFENTYALAMKTQLAKKLGIATISDLAPKAGGMEIGGDFEFFERPEWRILKEVYGLPFERQRAMETALLYQAAEQGKVHVISAYSTDGRLAAFNMYVLQDDRGAIPPYDAILLAGSHIARERPELLDALAELEGSISGSDMRHLNDLVDQQGRSPERVAAEFDVRQHQAHQQ